MQRSPLIPLIAPAQVTDLVEQKRGLTLSNGEINIYETRQEVLNFPLRFQGFTITSMHRGVKRVRFADAIERDYLPGNTILNPSHSELSIDFPEASLDQPTQCSAITLDNHFIRQNIQEFNEALVEARFIQQWRLLADPLLLENNPDLVGMLQKITKIATSQDSFRELHVQLLLKELVLCVLKLQNVNLLQEDAQKNRNNHPFSAILHYIRENIYREIQISDLLRISDMSKSAFYRAFGDELGISPYQLIIGERLTAAKKLLTQEKLSVKETAYATGFTSANYFIRLFKKHEGLTPKQYVARHRSAVN